MKATALVIVLIALALCMLLLLYYENKKIKAGEIILIAVMTAMSITGRFVFAAFPGFKPVTAIVIITGIYLGKEAGFYCGALTALITNFYFGQGAYTPFQMLIWGFIGIVSGVFCEQLKNKKYLLLIWGIISGVIFSLFMDVYTVIWTFGSFKWSMYLVLISSAINFTVIYALSNVFFLLALTKPIGKKLEHARFSLV